MSLAGKLHIKPGENKVLVLGAPDGLDEVWSGLRCGLRPDLAG